MPLAAASARAPSTWLRPELPMARCVRLLAGTQRGRDDVGLAPGVGQGRGERVQDVHRARARLVDVNRLELGRGGVQDLQVQGRLATGGQRLLEADAEPVDGRRGQAEAGREVAQVRVAEAVDLDQRHALPLPLQPGALQREVVVGGQILVGGEARLGDGGGAPRRRAGPLQIARLVVGALVPRGGRPVRERGAARDRRGGGSEQRLGVQADHAGHVVAQCRGNPHRGDRRHEGGTARSHAG